ncbi:hypothetical protein RI065_06500 [Mycoplasmatota bacterium zrk1]
MSQVGNAKLPSYILKYGFIVCYSIGITDALKAIWDGNMTPEEAQDQIILLANAWIEENNK